MDKFEHVIVAKKANVYFDGKCVSHTVFFPDGSRKTLGVIFPATLLFSTGAPETMELIAGKCRVKLAGETAWQAYHAGQSFSVAGNSAFEIEVLETLDYVCHFN